MTETYYIQQKGVRYDYSRRSNEQLAIDVTKAHDFIRKLVKEKDTMERRMQNQAVWVKILSAAVAGAWTLAVALLVILLKG